jgi:hypothetical protein
MPRSALVASALGLVSTSALASGTIEPPPGVDPMLAWGLSLAVTLAPLVFGRVIAFLERRERARERELAELARRSREDRDPSNDAHGAKLDRDAVEARANAEGLRALRGGRADDDE